MIAETAGIQLEGENLTIDIPRAREVAGLLLDAYRKEGVFGIRQGEMLENVPPLGSTRGNESHLTLITLTVALDYIRDHDQLWEAAHRSYSDERTNYLFDPCAVARSPYPKIATDMRHHGLSVKPEKDARIWQRISTTLAERYNGQVGKLIEAARGDALGLLDLVGALTPYPGFPSLKGPKIRLLWVKILADNLPAGLTRIEEVEVPVDIHTAQATLQTGCVLTRDLEGISPRLRRAIHQVWREAAVELGTGYHPLAVEEPLWVLSRNGCRNGAKWPCEHRDQCPVVRLCLTEQVWLRSQPSRHISRHSTSPSGPVQP